MAIYKLRYRIKSYLSVFIDNNELREKLGKMQFPKGDCMRDIWRAPEARLFNRSSNNTEGKLPQISDWNGNMVFSPQAFDTLADELMPFGEFLPVTIESDTWYLFNATTISNAVNESKSSQNIMDGMIMGVETLAFKADELEDILVFRTDYDRRMSVYCNETFKQLVQTHNFEAVLFREDLTAPL